MRDARYIPGWILALLVAVHGCGDDEPEEQKDAGGTCAEAKAAVSASFERWRALRKAEGSRYWYEEENCAPNMPGGSVTTVQVDSAEVERVRVRAIERDECEEQVNRYEDFRGATFEQLYASCEALVARECDAKFVTDDEGIVRTCAWDGDESCFDNCGHGFHIRKRGFGAAPEE